MRDGGGARPGGFGPRCWRSGKNKREWREAERTHAWLTRWRRILVRYEKKAANHEAVLQLAYRLLWYYRLWSVRAF